MMLHLYQLRVAALPWTNCSNFHGFKLTITVSPTANLRPGNGVADSNPASKVLYPGINVRKATGGHGNMQALSWMEAKQSKDSWKEGRLKR
ncbi:hypothetical protein SDJN02_05574, partial [Cucurbita argyrosperma subsp. argyrosperma]